MSKILLLVLLLTGCATHGPINPLPVVADATQAGEVVMIRASRVMGSAVTIPVTLDGVEIVGLRVGEHAVLRVMAGDHIVGIRYYGIAFSWEDVTLAVRIEPGREHYFRIDPAVGAILLNPVPPETGRALVGKTERIGL